MRRSPNGNETVLWRIQSGDEIGSTKTYTDREGATTLLFDQYDCDRAAEADSWEMAEDFAPRADRDLGRGRRGNRDQQPTRDRLR